MLLASTTPLTAIHDLAMLDLDGVVYVGAAAVPGAPAHIAAARGAGMRIAFITNNASRTATAVAEHLSELGVAASGADVVTSAQAAAQLIVGRWGAGARVLCLGAAGLSDALESVGLIPVGAEDVADVVATGYAPEVRWRDIMRVAVRIGDGLPWVASNTDHTIPTPYGRAPGHGVLVEMLAHYAGVAPVVAGKPERPLLEETIRRVGGTRPLMVGDRLDTDISGGRNAGVETLLVLTGVTGLQELVAARPGERPSYLASDLAGLTTSHPVPERDGDCWVLGGWRGGTADGVLQLEATSGADVDDGWRVAGVAAWHHLDTAGEVVDITGTHLPGPTAPAR